MKWIEGWYISYALLGLAAAGLAPILLPLAVSRSSGAAAIGVVMAAFSLGGLTAPVWGRFADLFRVHRLLLVAGLLGIAAGTLLFSFTSSLPLRIVLALAAGVGLAAASTVANLLIVEVRPREEWDARIGWLQTFYGGGQVLGLVLAGLIGTSAPVKGLRFAGLVSLAAIIPALTGTRRDSSVIGGRPALSRPVHHAEWPVGSPQHLYHHAHVQDLKRIVGDMASPFGLFLIAWLFSFAGSAALFSFYPVVMEQTYGLSPGFSSTGYALAAGLGLVLYAPAGRWSERRGALTVLRGALVLRIVSFFALAVLATASLREWGMLAQLFFLFIVLAWSLLSVSGTALVASLSPQNEGEGLGLFNAVTALSGVVGSVAGGWVAGRWGYGAIPLAGIIGVSAGLLMLSFRGTQPASEDQQRLQGSSIDCNVFCKERR